MEALNSKQELQKLLIEHLSHSDTYIYLSAITGREYVGVLHIVINLFRLKAFTEYLIIFFPSAVLLKLISSKVG